MDGVDCYTLRLICEYTTSGGRILAEKQPFHDFNDEWDIHSVDGFCCAWVTKGHNDGHFNGFGGVCEMYCVGQWNLEGIMLIDLWKIRKVVGNMRILRIEMILLNDEMKANKEKVIQMADVGIMN